MIQLYTWGTPNGKKVSIMLEEIGMAYEVHAINIGQGDQLKPEYLAINPNNKIPTIIDTDGPGGKPFKLFESGAILLYLAEKSGKLWPDDLSQRYTVIQWLMFQMGGVGPMFGQANYFYRLEEKVPYAIERFTKKPCGFTTCWISNWARANISPALTRSLTSPPIHGFGATMVIM